MDKTNIYKTKTFEAYAEFCLMNGIEATEERLQACTQFLLKDYSDELIASTIRGMVSANKFFPSVSDVIAAMNPSKDAVQDIANMMANRILKIAAKVSPDDKNAKNFFSDKEWFIVGEAGGLDLLCKLRYDQITTTRAHIRDVCRGYINNGFSENTLNLIQNKLKGINQIGDLLPDFSKE